MSRAENGRRQDLQKLPLRTRRQSKSKDPSRQERRSDSEHVLESKSFEDYYKAQEILSWEEFPLFLETLRRPLPSVFRVAEVGRLRDVVVETLDQFPQAMDGSPSFHRVSW
uniref:Uncharacterized protein n=3 Tax=Rhodosorus marinus TaxID=101924 RepID=A0A7S2ZV90_9RHOD|mmetsp:Transcript_33072/g.129917  ORF Transcript_33072/g.129917 Transcript_33072/m.129917 type:complete len:111 (+) Transcript_33072:263-595(+)